MAKQGEWKLSGGVWTDGSGNANTLTKVGTVSQATGFLGGANTAASIAGGSSNHLEITDAAQTGLGGSLAALTILFRIKIHASSTTLGMMVTKWLTAQQSYAVFNSAANLITFNLSKDGTAVLNLDSATTLSAGTWYDVACEYDGTNQEIFIDDMATPDATVALTGSLFNGTAKFMIGGYDDGVAFSLYGSVDDVRFYDSALTQTQREDHFAAIEDFVQPVPTGSLSFTGQVPILSPGIYIAVPSGSLSFTGQVPITTVVGTLAGTVRDRAGNAVDCSSYNVRVNAYPRNNTVSAPLATQLTTSAIGAWSITGLTKGVKYLVTFEYEGTYVPLGDVDVSGAEFATDAI